MLARHQWLMSVILATWKAEIRRITVRDQPRQIIYETLSQKYSTQKRAGGIAQVVEHLSSKSNSVNSNPVPQVMHLTAFSFSAWKIQSIFQGKKSDEAQIIHLVLNSFVLSINIHYNS
jgi:hypothetical protein